MMSDEIRAIGDLLVQPGFHAGLISGLVGAALIVVIWLIRRQPVPGWALVLAAATAAALASQFEVDSTWVSAVVVLAVSGALVDVAHRLLVKMPFGVVLAWLPGVVGAMWAANLVGLRSPSWVIPGFAGFTFLVAVGLWLASRSSFPEVVGPMVAIAVAGSWVTVPETDIVIVFVGAVIPLGLLTLRPIAARLWATGALTYAGLLGWVVMGGGLARPWTIVGAWSAALGITLVAVIGSMRGTRPARLFTIYLIYAIVVTRVADFVDTLAPMITAAAVLLVVTGVVAWSLLGSKTESSAVTVDA